MVRGGSRRRRPDSATVFLLYNTQVRPIKYLKKIYKPSSLLIYPVSPNTVYCNPSIYLQCIPILNITVSAEPSHASDANGEILLYHSNGRKDL